MEGFYLCLAVELLGFKNRVCGLISDSFCSMASVVGFVINSVGADGSTVVCCCCR